MEMNKEPVAEQRNKNALGLSDEEASVLRKGIILYAVIEALAIALGIVLHYALK